VELNAFFWKADIFEGRPLIGDWVKPYNQIFYANSVLEAIPKISGTREEVDQIAYSISKYTTDSDVNYTSLGV
jgi:hypothetical protein